MKNYVVTFTGLYKDVVTRNPFTITKKKIGTAKAYVPVYGLFLSFRKSEVTNKILTEVWPEVQMKSGATGFEDFFVEEY